VSGNAGLEPPDHPVCSRPAGPGTWRLPANARLVLDTSVRRFAGCLLTGGAPLRIMRLSAKGAFVLDRLVAGTVIGDEPATQRLARGLLDAGIVHPRLDPYLIKPAEVTVVIPVRDRTRGLEDTLGALSPDLRVIVVDDGSVDRDDLINAIRRLPRRAATTVLHHDRHMGAATARNTGWRATRTAFVAFVDADCKPEPGWLAPLLAQLGDPAVGAVAPRVLSGDRAADPKRCPPPSMVVYETYCSPLDLGPREGPVRPGSWVPYVPTAAMVARRAALEDVGGFDETLRYGEDVDLVWRLDRAGWRVRYEPASIVVHPPRPSLVAWLRQRARYGYSAAPLARRHGGAVTALDVSPWSAAIWVALAAGQGEIAVALAAGTTFALDMRTRSQVQPPLPSREVARLALRGHLLCGESVARAVTKVWWPVAVLAAAGFARARRVLLVVALAPHLAEWIRRRPTVGVAQWCAMRLADDIAYGAGVWVGCAKENSFTSLLPRRTRARRVNSGQTTATSLD